ncbi:tyrosine-type recombinase/integrase [Paenibacillus glacialis]|uniref:Tyr recombinase domain-containing protein n=1 Tax=Paenibacillus glacialis TaxID=494026 RepID=A0A168C2X8_9BACL|nr:site-specific integrase [Paenibacillus glacialis]OAB32997.1 hypothetical protein PGLA_26320 [Paenibacillus glacialis]
MSRILLDSPYYINWRAYSDLKESAKVVYSYHIRRFESYLIKCGYQGHLDFDRFYYYTESHDYSPIDKCFISKYILYLEEEQKNSTGVLCNTIIYLKQFFSFLFDIGMIKTNPMKHFRNKYYVRKIIDRSLSLEECRSVLATAEKTDPFTKMSYILFLTMLTTGLRNSEVVELTHQQIDFERNVIHINKGHKTTAEVVYMPTVLAELLKLYFKHPSFDVWVRTENKHVFFQNGKPFSNRMLTHFVKKIMIESGITRNITPHCLRHTTAYLMQLNGISLSAIKRQLRHKSSATTLRYLPPVQLSIELLDQVVVTISMPKKNGKP